MTNWTRRRFLGSTAAVAAVKLLGMARVEAKGFVPDCGLAPGTVGVGPIDVHTHVFNATDLQVERFLSRVIAPGLPPLLRPVIRLLGPILQTAGWAAAPDGDTELARLKDFDTLGSLEARVAAVEASKLVDRDRRDGLSRFRDEFSRQLQTPFGRRFLNAYETYRRSVLARKRTLSTAEQRVQQFSVNELATPQRLLDYLEIERQVPGLAEIFNFVSRFFQYRYVNAAFLLENYGCKNKLAGSEGPGVFSCLMVDFDYGLDAGRFPPPTRLDKQIEVMGRIAVLTDGRILPFVAFDPWRYVYEGNSALTRVVNAVKEGGSVGVKLYPPMGFAPSGNAAIRPKPKWPFEDFPDFDKQLDAAMGKLLSWCATEGVPVIAHANRSNAAQPTYLDLGSPRNWKTALDVHPGLHVCFGHFGGECLLDGPARCKGASGWPSGFLERFGQRGGETPTVIGLTSRMLSTTPTGRPLLRGSAPFTRRVANWPGSVSCTVAIGS